MEHYAVQKKDCKTEDGKKKKKKAGETRRFCLGDLFVRRWPRDEEDGEEKKRPGEGEDPYLRRRRRSGTEKKTLQNAILVHGNQRGGRVHTPEESGRQ